jgi:hypothetical protein
VEQLDDAGAGIQVLPNWDGFRLARAGRFSYWTSPLSESAPEAPSVDGLAPFLVRRPFAALGRTPYLQHRDYDSATVVADASTHAPFVVRVPFRALGRNPYLRHGAQDELLPFDLPARQRVVPFRSLGRNPYLRQSAQDLSVVEPLDLPARQRVVPFRGLGRNPYLQHRDYDSVAAPAQPDTAPSQLIRHQFGGYRRRPQLGWSPSIEGTPQLNDAGGSFRAVRSLEGFRLARAGRFNYWQQARDAGEVIVTPLDLPHVIRRVPFRPLWRSRYLHHSAQDTSAPVEPSTWATHFVRIPLKRYGRNPYTRHYAQDTNAPAPTFVAAWAKNANAILGAGKVA